MRERVRRRARTFLGQQEVHARLDRQLARIEETERELARVAPQLAALEARLETLRERVERSEPEPQASRPGVPGAWEDEMVNLKEEVARQQKQVRARISAAARYEERLRRLEDALGSPR